MQTIFCQFIWIAISFCGFFFTNFVFHRCCDCNAHFSISKKGTIADIVKCVLPDGRWSVILLWLILLFFFYQMMTIYHPYMIVYCYGPSIWDLCSFPNIQRWPSAQPLLCSVQAEDSGEEFICFFFYCSIYSGWMTAALRNAQAWLRSLEKGNRKSFSFM